MPNSNKRPRQQDNRAKISKPHVQTKQVSTGDLSIKDSYKLNTQTLTPTIFKNQWTKLYLTSMKFPTMTDRLQAIT